MRAVLITEHGGPEVLRVQERPDPVPGPGEVLIDVRAAGINFADLMARIGFYPDAPKPPCVVGYEVAGTVAALGPGAEGGTGGAQLTLGQRVVAPTMFGGYAERAVARADGVVALPDELSFEQGAAIPINYATAWEALIRQANLQPGERVLIHSAGGGVGIAATQIARRRSAEVWGTASPGKHAAIRGFGVDHAVDYTRRGWERGIPELDVVMDALGGTSFRRSYRLLRAGGRLVCFGAAGVVAGERRNLVAAARTGLTMPRFNLIKQMSDSKAVIGLNLLSIWKAHGSAARWREPLRELLADGTIQPVVAESFSFERAGEAHRFIAERRNIGKVVLVP
jgi:NADPH:quinone reductase-like Zn-dependent oxidoreductase